MQYADQGLKRIFKLVEYEVWGKNILSVNELRLHKISYNLVPGARVGHIVLYRDVIVIDTILAFGHSTVAAMERIQEFNSKSMKFIYIISSPEGIDIFHRFYPDIPIYTLSVDR